MHMKYKQSMQFYYLSCLSLGRCQSECEEEATAVVVTGTAHTSLQHSPHMSGRDSSYL